MKYFLAILISTTSLCLGLVGCAPERKPGPVEQIGRGLDQIIQGATEIDKKNAEEERERQRKRDAARYDWDDDRYYDRDRQDDTERRDHDRTRF